MGDPTVPAPFIEVVLIFQSRIGGPRVCGARFVGLFCDYISTRNMAISVVKPLFLIRAPLNFKETLGIVDQEVARSNRGSMINTHIVESPGLIARASMRPRICSDPLPCLS
jgi:hypothetical protein